MWLKGIIVGHQVIIKSWLQSQSQSAHHHQNGCYLAIMPQMGVSSICTGQNRNRRITIHSILYSQVDDAFIKVILSISISFSRTQKAVCYQKARLWLRMKLRETSTAIR